MHAAKLASLLALSASALVSTPALCSDTITVTLEKTQNPVQHKFIDVLGFYPGQPGTETKKLVDKVQKKSPDIMTLTLTPKVKGVYVRTKYQGGMRVQVGATDYLELYSGSPVTDSQIIGIKRVVNFSDPFSAPKSDELGQSLIEKYGKPSLDKKEKGFRDLMWVFTGPNTVKSCKDRMECPWNIDLNNPSQIDTEKAFKKGIIAIMKVYLTQTSEMRVSSMTLSVDDIENRMLDNQSVDKFLDDTISKQLSNGKSAKPAL